MKKNINLKHSTSIPFTGAQYDRMKALYESGKSASQISSIFGISKSSVLRRLHALDIDVRSVGSKCARGLIVAAEAAEHGAHCQSIQMNTR